MGNKRHNKKQKKTMQQDTTTQFKTMTIGACVPVTMFEALALKEAEFVLNTRIEGKDIPLTLSPLAQAILDAALTVKIGQGEDSTENDAIFDDLNDPQKLSPVVVLVKGELACIEADAKESNGESVARLVHGFLSATQNDRTHRIEVVLYEQSGKNLIDVQVKYWSVDRWGIRRVTPWQMVAYEEIIPDLITYIAEKDRDPAVLARFGLSLIDQTGLPRPKVITNPINTFLDIDFAQAAQNVQNIVTLFDQLLAGCFDPVVAERREDVRALARMLAHVETQMQMLKKQDH